jgi:hydroxyethylthiazole kinase-like sugar kinase family protein
MLSLDLLRTVVRNIGALTLRGNSSTLILFADGKRLVFGVDALATTTFAIVDRTRHD